MKRSRASESGQAVVEAAIILPAMIFLLLVTIQLTQLQQARIMVEYAAFAAARAGIVFNADSGKMRTAAIDAVLPTFGRTDSLASLAKTKLKFEALDRALGAGGLRLIRIYAWGPTDGDFARYGAHLNGKEIDFDDTRPQVAPLNLLSLQVRYLYDMRVPFANRMLQTIWMASHLARGLRPSDWKGWDWTGPKIGSQKGPDAVHLARILALSRTVPDGTPEGISLARVEAAAALPGRPYFMPVEAWYTMRMQSNFYRGTVNK